MHVKKKTDSFIAERGEQQDILDEFTVKIEHAITARKINTDNPKKEVNELKVPNLSLTSFSGQIHKCLRFKGWFNITIHENANLLTVQKLQYLKLPCHNDVLQIIISKPILNSNCSVTWGLFSEKISN